MEIKIQERQPSNHELAVPLLDDMFGKNNWCWGMSDTIALSRKGYSGIIKPASICRDTHISTWETVDVDEVVKKAFVFKPKRTTTYKFNNRSIYKYKFENGNLILELSKKGTD